MQFLVFFGYQELKAEGCQKTESVLFRSQQMREIWLKLRHSFEFFERCISILWGRGTPHTYQPLQPIKLEQYKYWKWHGPFLCVVLLFAMPCAKRGLHSYP